ncbi:uncharacterized protein TNCV_4977731 [Trichonephila clavipes]|nr:uncharacterized protein TNCV_4977731 [Trichonephila clavipes]
MAPHTITAVVGAVYHCKAKAGLKRSPRVHFPRARHHSKRRRRWVGVKGSTRNGRRDPRCPSAKHLCMVQEDTGAHSEGPTFAWRAADEAAGCTRAFITMWLLGRRCTRRGKWPNDNGNLERRGRAEENCKYANFPLLPELLKNVPATAHQKVWFMHESA